MWTPPKNANIIIIIGILKIIDCDKKESFEINLKKEFFTDFKHFFINKINSINSLHLIVLFSGEDE